MNEIDVDPKFIILHIQGYIKLDVNLAGYSFLFLHSLFTGYFGRSDQSVYVCGSVDKSPCSCNLLVKIL